MKDATDYLNTEEARGYLERERMRVLEDAKLHPEKYQDANGNLDPAKVEAEIQRQQLANAGDPDVRPAGQVPVTGKNCRKGRKGRRSRKNRKRRNSWKSSWGAGTSKGRHALVATPICRYRTGLSRSEISRIIYLTNPISIPPLMLKS